MVSGRWTWAAFSRWRGRSGGPGRMPSSTRPSSWIRRIGGLSTTPTRACSCCSVRGSPTSRISACPSTRRSCVRSSPIGWASIVSAAAHHPRPGRRTAPADGLSRYQGQALPGELRPDPHRGGERRPGPERPGDPLERLRGSPTLLLPGGAGRPADRLPLSPATQRAVYRRRAVDCQLGRLLSTSIGSTQDVIAIDGARLSSRRIALTASIHRGSPLSARHNQYSLPQNRTVPYPASFRFSKRLRIAAGLVLFGLV